MICTVHNTRLSEWILRKFCILSVFEHLPRKSYFHSNLTIMASTLLVAAGFQNHKSSKTRRNDIKYSFTFNCKISNFYNWRSSHSVFKPQKSTQLNSYPRRTNSHLQEKSKRDVNTLCPRRQILQHLRHATYDLHYHSPATPEMHKNG